MKKLIGSMLVLLVCSPSFATQADTTHSTNIAVTGNGDSYTPDVTFGASGCVYVESTLEVDGATRFDSTIDMNGIQTFDATPVFNTGIDLNEDADVDFDARDEEFNITTSSNVPAGYGVVQVVNTSADVSEQHYLLELWQKNQAADADGDFIICKDSSTARTLFTVSEGGNTAVAGTLAVTGATTLTGAVGVTGVATFTAAPIVSAGMIGKTDAGGSLNYEIIVTTTLADNTDYVFAPAAGKAGSFIVIGGTYTVTGSFTTAGAVTLGLSSTETSTTNGNDGTVNVYDAGTSAGLDNQSGGSAVFTIRYNYVN